MSVPAFILCGSRATAVLPARTHSLRLTFSSWRPLHGTRAAAPHHIDMTTHVFLVEDNLVIRDSLLAAMEDIADMAVVGTAQTEAEALAWLTSNAGHWDLLVVDLFLVEGSGMEVVKACAGRGPAQRVIVLTNYAEVASSRALLRGADAVFDKTTQLDDFLAYVQRCTAEVDRH